MVACFGCTKCGCYQDKDVVQYYGAADRQNASLNSAGLNGQAGAGKNINGSDYHRRPKEMGIEEEERQKARLLAGPKAEVMDLK